jgi:hypothetical protein
MGPRASYPHGAVRDQTGVAMYEHHPRSPYVAEWHALEERLEAGEPLVSLEAAIDQAPVDDDERAALWLASWARASQRERRVVAIPGLPS